MCKENSPFLLHKVLLFLLSSPRFYQLKIKTNKNINTTFSNPNQKNKKREHRSKTLKTRNRNQANGEKKRGVEQPRKR